MVRAFSCSTRVRGPHDEHETLLTGQSKAISSPYRVSLSCRDQTLLIKLRFRMEVQPHFRQCTSRVVCRLGTTPLFDPSRLHVQFKWDSTTPLITSSCGVPISILTQNQTPSSKQQQHYLAQASQTQNQQHRSQQVQVAQGPVQVEALLPSILPRCYTVTHSDVSGDIFLAIGPETNKEQLESFSTKFFRDEVVAEWKLNTSASPFQPVYSLHIHCHVSGGHPLLAPGHLRNWIFQREMPLVLQCICHAERQLLSACPDLRLSPVWVHYHSSNPSLDRADCWGPLGLAAEKEYEEPLSHAFMSLIAYWSQRILPQEQRRPRPAAVEAPVEAAVEGEGGLYQAGYEFAAWMAHPRHMPPLVLTLTFAFVLWLNTVVLNYPLLALE